MWIIMDILELYVTINYGMMSLCAMYVVALLLKYWSSGQWDPKPFILNKVWGIFMCQTLGGRGDNPAQIWPLRQRAGDTPGRWPAVAANSSGQCSLNIQVLRHVE